LTDSTTLRGQKSRALGPSRLPCRKLASWRTRRCRRYGGLIASAVLQLLNRAMTKLGKGAEWGPSMRIPAGDLTSWFPIEQLRGQDQQRKARLRGHLGLTRRPLSGPRTTVRFSARSSFLFLPPGSPCCRANRRSRLRFAYCSSPASNSGNFREFRYQAAV
jgi:hypothetical protein